MTRTWYWTHDSCTNEPTDPLWAIVERLEALVGVMDELEQVGDVIANHLSFGGQPVGEGTHPANWQCQKTKECTLFNGHQGPCVRPDDNAVTLKSCPMVHPATGEKCMLFDGHDDIHAFEEEGTHDGEGPEPRTPDFHPDDRTTDKPVPVVVGGVKFEPVTHGGYPTPVTPPRKCQCMKPQFDTGNVCGRCGFPKEVSHAE